jgi:cytochrome c oxidase assembly protein subunit 15
MSADTPDAAARLSHLFPRMALAATVLTFVVIVSSAYMRHVQAGLTCNDWPTCYGILGGAEADRLPLPGVWAARIAHRFAAAGVLILVVGMLLLASIEKPARKNVRRLTAVALVITMALAVLGIATPGTRLPVVTLANLLGGYLLLALFAATLGVTMAARDGSMPRRASLRLLALVVLASGLVQAAAGGLIGAQVALTACPTLVSCPDYPYGQFLSSPAFDPFRPLSIVDGRVALSPRAAGVHVIHREIGTVVLVFTLIVAVALRRHMPRRAVALAVLALATPLLGAAAVVAMPSLPLTLFHNACAAVLVATLATAGLARASDNGAR